MDKLKKELISVLDGTLQGIEKTGVSDYRVNYGSSYMQFTYYEYTGNVKPIHQKIVILRESNMDDILEELHNRISMKPEYLGEVKNIMNIHARGELGDYIDREKNNPPFMAEG